jgi:hypothetical protein
MLKLSHARRPDGRLWRGGITGAAMKGKKQIYFGIPCRLSFTLGVIITILRGEG